MAKADTGQRQLLLLDLGGVLLQLNDPVKTFGIGSTREEFNRIWLLSPAVQALESGAIDHAAFAQRMVQDLQLPYSAADFMARFAAWPDRIPGETIALLQRIPAHIDCAILSNTNDLHWQNLAVQADLRGKIGHFFLSYETGLIKPDSRAFQHALDETGFLAERVTFIDDNPINVAAAAQMGMRAALCSGVEALGQVLHDTGILTATSA